MKNDNFYLYIQSCYFGFKSIIYRKWNRFIFMLAKVEYGKNLNVYNRVYLQGYGKVKIGNDFVFTSGDAINPICRNICGVLYTMTPEACIEIGDRVGISSTCIWAKEKIKIGNDVNIGGDCIIIDNDAHPINYLQRKSAYVKEVGRDVFFSKIVSSPIEIGDDVWIGARCQILKGVKIGARSIIAAGSIVTKDIPADVIAGGNPCKIIKKLNAEVE